MLSPAGGSSGGAHLGSASPVRHNALKIVAVFHVSKAIRYPTKLLTLETTTNATLERLTL